MQHTPLQPRHASPVRRVLAEVDDPFARLADAFDTITSSDRATPPAWLPYLIWQYGLGELAPFITNGFRLIEVGIPWQRVRGTPASISQAIGWFNYSGTTREAATRRRLWNKIQLHLSAVRAADFPDLPRINGLVDVSLPVRSRFTRGFHGHDIPAAEPGYTRTGACLLGTDSGIAIQAGRARWSFGRRYDLTYDVSAAELIDLDAYVPAVPDWGLWSEINIRWADLNLYWQLPALVARRKAIWDNLAGRTVLMRFATAAGATIGYRRCVMQPVRAQVPGQYTIGGAEYVVDAEAPDVIMIRAQTGFTDGAGQSVASIGFVFDPVFAVGVPPGRLWLSPAQVVGGVSIGGPSVAVDMGMTVRERVTVLIGLNRSDLYALGYDAETVLADGADAALATKG